MRIKGIALYYYTGERVNGNVTIIPVEKPFRKTSLTFTNGEWYKDFYIEKDEVQYMMIIVDDSQKIGYSYLKLDNPVTTSLTCTIQNISLSGYSIDVAGNTITYGNLIVSVLDTDYTNTTSLQSSGNWNIDFHPCLISGKIYTIQILLTDNSGRRGIILQKYPAR